MDQMIKLQLKNKAVSVPFPPSVNALYKLAARSFEECKLSSQHRFFVRDRPVLTDNDLLRHLNLPNPVIQIKNVIADPNPSVVAMTPSFALALWHSSNTEYIENCQVSLVCSPIIIPGKNPRILGGETHIEVDPLTLFFRDFKMMQVPRYHFAWCTYGHKIFVIGGVESNGYTSTCEVYDMESNCWYFFDDHPGTGRSGMSAVCWASNLFCFGGFDGIEYSDSIMHYKVLERFWVSLSLTLPFCSYYIGVADVGDGVLVVGGRQNRVCYLMCPVEMNFTRLSDLPDDLECTRVLMRPVVSLDSVLFTFQDLQILRFDLKLNLWAAEDKIVHQRTSK